MRHVARLGALAGIGLAVACSGQAPTPEDLGAASESIVNGTAASSYPEAILIDMYQQGQLYAACSGSVIAPQVVLTAGHCVDGTDSWKVTAPYANKQKANASSGATYDWAENGSETVNPNHHDIGLVFLDTPIQLSAYPELASAPIQAGDSVINIGRIRNGQLSTTGLYVSGSITVDDGANQGFPFDYAAQDVIESGDSGGPDEIPGSATHKIVSVNSGGGNGEVLARVDLLYSWIEQQIAAHGGGGFTSPLQGSDGGTPPVLDAGSSTKPDAGSSTTKDAGGSPWKDAGLGTADAGHKDAGGSKPTADGGSTTNGADGSTDEPPTTGNGDGPPDSGTGQASGCAVATAGAGGSPSGAGTAGALALVALGAIVTRRRRN